MYSSYIPQHWLMHIQATPMWLEINWNWKQRIQVVLSLKWWGGPWLGGL